MFNASKEQLRITYLVSLLGLLALTLALDRWWACLPLVLLATWLFQTWRTPAGQIKTKND